MYAHEGIIIPVIMHCRIPESCKFKKSLGFRISILGLGLGFKLHNVNNCKKQTVLESIKDTFEAENMQTQYSVLGYKIDLYFHEYKLAIEVDELDHNEINIDSEIQRQRAIEKENFKIFKAINEIHRHIKKSTKKSLIDKISKRLLELAFKSNHSIITKALKRVVKKLLSPLSNMVQSVKRARLTALVVNILHTILKKTKNN